MDFIQILCSYFLVLLTRLYVLHAVSWEEWWTYDGISDKLIEEFNQLLTYDEEQKQFLLLTVDQYRQQYLNHLKSTLYTCKRGPAFWGLINPEWSLCNKGRRQSPVNLEPQRLLFDPNLRPVHIDKHRISGLITNTGHSVIFTAGNDTVANYDGMQIPVNITGGPLSYRYRFHEIHIHYGLHDQFGSEHSVDGYTFPAEIQIFGYNSQLYNNFSDALNRAQGIVGVSILLQLGDLSNPELRMLTDSLDRIRYGGDEAFVKRLSIRGLLPDTDHYMTYDGSTTAPACHETVTWVVLNKPIYITKQQLHALRRLMQGSPDHPKAPLGNNYRPPQPLLHRPIRTNIDFKTSKANGKSACPTMYKEVYYKATSWKQH